MVVLLTAAGVAEGVGVITLLPLLELIVMPSESQGSGLNDRFSQLLSAIGLEPSVGLLLTLIVLAVSGKALFVWVAMRQVGFTVARVTTNLRLDLLRAILRARWSYYVSQRSGHIVNSVSTEAHRAASAYREACVVLANLLQAFAYFVVALLVSWPMALGAVVIGGAFFLALRGLVQLARSAGKDQTLLIRSVVARLTDALRGIKPVRAMGREADLLFLLEKETEELNQALKRQVSASETLRLFQEPVVSFLLALGLFGALVIAGQPLTAVLVLAFIFYRLMGTLNQVQMRYQIATVGESAFWSLQEEIGRARAEAEETSGVIPAPVLDEGIRLEDVHFSYGDKAVLVGVSLEIPARSFVALYGPSGSGKTTIADLIIGLIAPSSGAVYVDGLRLGEVDITEWRRKIGYVPQDVFLLNDTVYRNIALGDESIKREAVVQALKQAGAWGFVSERPAGIDTVLGEGGGNLSGGQRQRISIARALVRRPSLLLLDEATAALDPTTEAAILDTLGSLRESMTILAISHQPAVRRVADFSYDLAHGVITGKTSPTKV